MTAIVCVPPFSYGDSGIREAAAVVAGWRGKLAGGLSRLCVPAFRQREENGSCAADEIAVRRAEAVAGRPGRRPKQEVDYLP